MLKRGRSRSVLTVLLSFGLFAAQLLPQEHAHPAEAPHHQGGAEIHRHFTAHGPVSRDAVVDHEDDDAVWIVATFVAPGDGGGSADRLTMSAHPVDPLAARSVSSRPLNVTHPVSIHDPPFLQSAGLRGPPASLL